MAVTLYYGSGSPYAWRAWLALEHKGIPYELKTMSFNSGDLKRPEFLALNPRGRVPVLVDDGFAIYESAAIVDYAEDRWPAAPRLYSIDMQARATQRRMIREVDQYFAAAMERLVDAVLFTPKEKRDAKEVAKAVDEIRLEAARWEGETTHEFLTGAMSAPDFALYPCTALVRRIGERNPGTVPADVFGPNLTRWMALMERQAVVQATWPPHWK